MYASSKLHFCFGFYPTVPTHLHKLLLTVRLILFDVCSQYAGIWIFWCKIFLHICANPSAYNFLLNPVMQLLESVLKKMLLLLRPEAYFKHLISLFKNQRFMLEFDEMFQWNASNFAIFLEYENLCTFPPFHFVLFSP